MPEEQSPTQLMKRILDNVVREMLQAKSIFSDSASDERMKTLSEGGITAYYDVYSQLVTALMPDIPKGASVEVDQEGEIRIVKGKTHVN